MTKKLVIFSLLLIGSPLAISARATFAKELCDAPKANDPKLYYNDTLKALYQVNDMLQTQDKNCIRMKALVGLRQLSLTQDMIQNGDARNWFGMNNGYKGGKDYIDLSVAGNDLMFFSEQEVPEIYEIVKKHANALGLSCPAVFLCRIKNLDKHWIASFAQWQGMLMLEESLLKQKMSDEAFEGYIIYQLASMKNNQFFSQSAFEFFKSKKGLATLNLLLLSGKSFTNWMNNRNLPTKPEEKKTLATENSFPEDVYEIEYSQLASTTIRTPKKPLPSTKSYLPWITVNIAWILANRIHFGPDADKVGAYSIDSAQKLIAYIKMLQKQDDINDKAWDNIESGIKKADCSMLEKTLWLVAHAFAHARSTVEGVIMTKALEPAERIATLEKIIQQKEAALSNSLPEQPVAA
jgi:hypothetical protein